MDTRSAAEAVVWNAIRLQDVRSTGSCGMHRLSLQARQSGQPPGSSHSLLDTISPKYKDMESCRNDADRVDTGTSIHAR